MSFDTSEDLCKHVSAAHNGRCLLAFSTGKDAIGAYLQLRRHFEDIIPFYLYLVPGLEFVDESLTYYEGILGRRILRLPHPSLYRWLNNSVFQAPQNLETVYSLELPDFDYQDISRVILEDYNLPLDLYTASGVRAVDSPNRWASIKKHGPINEKKQTFYPVFDWNKARLLAEIEESGIKLPVDYKMFGRTFDGLDYRFLYPIREMFPRDYARILEYFPLADIELARIAYRDPGKPLHRYWEPQTPAQGHSTPYSPIQGKGHK